MSIHTKPDSIEYNKKYTQVVDVQGTLDLKEIFEDYLPECDLLERIDDYFGNNTSSFSQYYTVSEFFAEKLKSVSIHDSLNEDEIAYVVSAVNPSKLESFSVYSNSVEDTSPIVDALLLTCKESLRSVSFSCDKISVIDNRLFTEFPNVKSNSIGLSGCKLWYFNDSNKITLKDTNVYYTLSQQEYEEARSNAGSPRKRIQWIFEEKLLPEVVFNENVSYSANYLTSFADVDLYYTYNEKTAYLGSISFRYVVQADPTKDNVVDSFDVAMATEYVNSFEEPADETAKIAMDVVADGYIDATDLAYITYIANFEE